MTMPRGEAAQPEFPLTLVAGSVQSQDQPKRSRSMRGKLAIFTLLCVSVAGYALIGLAIDTVATRGLAIF